MRTATVDKTEMGQKEAVSFDIAIMEVMARAMEKTTKPDYLESYKGATVLITGGAGCIGSNLTRALIKADAKSIIVLDDLSAAEKWNIPVDSRVTFILGSVTDDEIMKRAFLTKPSYVFHLAAHFANQNSVDNPVVDLDVNGLGVLKALQYSQLAGIKRFVFASSGCSVYGSKAPLPLKEDFVSLHLDTPYQITKLLGELYCNFFHNYYKLPVVRARYFNVFGPGEVPGAYRNVIPNFIYWAMNKKPLPITGTGEETRDFTYVDDIVEGTLLCGVVDEAVGDAFNLASQTETTVMEIANQINSITRNTESFVFKERRDWDQIVKRCASIEKARKILGYNPKTSVKDGIPKVYEWMLKNWKNIEQTARF
jgi:UDP-glucose 4-epimerase